MSCFTDYQNGRSKPFNGDIWFISWSISMSIDWSPCSQFDNAAKYVQLCLLRLCIILWSTSHRSIKFNLRSHKLWTFNCFIKLGPMPPYGRRPRLDRQVRIQLGRVHFGVFSTSPFVPPALSSDWTWSALSSSHPSSVMEKIGWWQNVTHRRHMGFSWFQVSFNGFS